MKLKHFFTKNISLLLLTLSSVINICSSQNIAFIEKTNFRNFEEDNILKLNDEYQTLEQLTKFSVIEYSKYKDKKIDIFYAVNNKTEVLYSFLKNVFCYNFDQYLQIWLSKYLSIDYPLVTYSKKNINFTNTDIYIDYEFSVLNKTYKTNANISLLKSSKINNDNNIVFNLNVNDGSSDINLFNSIENFNFLEITSNFNYEIDYYKTDISKITDENLNQLFSIYSILPNNVYYKVIKNDFKEKILVENISYSFNNGIQKFNLNYQGNKIFDNLPIDISIKDNNFVNKFNILNLDIAVVDNFFHIGNTIKNIGYKINITKNINQNTAKIEFLINPINQNCLFYQSLKMIQKNYIVNLNFNDDHILKIDVKPELKNKLLPSNFENDDISLTGTIDISSINIKEIRIINSNNYSGSLNVEINYIYKNYFGTVIDAKESISIENLLKIEYLEKQEIKNYLINTYYKENEFNFDKFKDDFINSNSFEWLLKEDNIFISKQSIDATYKNNILILSFFIENKDKEIIHKENYEIDLSINKNDNTSPNIVQPTNNKKELEWYYWLLIGIGALVTLIIIYIIYLKIRRRKNIIK